jgi:hypothetical protein
MTASLLSVVAKERSASWLGSATNSFVRSKKVWIKAARVLRSAVISASERTVGEGEALGEAEASEEGEVEGEAAEEDTEGKARDELWSSGTVSSRTKVSESVAKVTPVIDAADRIE